MQLGFYFDQTRCTGCWTCVVACKDWNDIPAGPASWRQVTSVEEGDWPNLFLTYFSSSCYHCADPICAAVCPAEAIFKRREDGIVVVDTEKCRQAAPCGIISGPKSISFGQMWSPCTMACPAGVNAQGYVALVAKGRFQEALDLIRRDLPLPSVCGRVCKHPCESACKRQELDEPIAITALKRFATDRGLSTPDPLPITKSQKVAVVGSGPAGLAAAWELLKRGYPVTVFEALPVPGGMLAVGIPAYRLPKKVLQRDIDYLKALGIEIRTNCPIGTDLRLDDLKAEAYEAIFIAIGAHRSQRLGVKGENLNGVYGGLQFLRQLNLSNGTEIGRKVVVVGGGYTAIDAARCALRLGAHEVAIIYRRQKEDMPAGAEELVAAQEEGVKIEFLVAPTEVIGAQGKVVGLRCQRMRLGDSDSSGRRHTVPIEGSEFMLDTDMVIAAIGQSPELDPFPDITTTAAGTIAVEPTTLATSEPGVFAGGDAVGNPASVIDAIAAGRLAAASIDRFLQGLVVRETKSPLTISASEIEVEIPSSVQQQPRQPMPTVPRAQRRSFQEVALGFSEEAALAEAARCLNCAGHLCREVCPYSAPQFGAEDNPKMQMCNLCLDRWSQGKKPICVAACPTRALDAGPLEEMRATHGDTREAEGFTYSASTRPSITLKPKKRRAQSSGKLQGLEQR